MFFSKMSSDLFVHQTDATKSKMKRTSPSGDLTSAYISTVFMTKLRQATSSSLLKREGIRADSLRDSVNMS